jgi:hypothetical protein
MKWQPIETAPKDGTYIDLWADNFRFADAFWFDPKTDDRWHGIEEGWVFHSEGFEYVWVTPTHWMPIPGNPDL